MNRIILTIIKVVTWIIIALIIGLLIYDHFKPIPFIHPVNIERAEQTETPAEPQNEQPSVINTPDVIINPDIKITPIIQPELPQVNVPDLPIDPIPVIPNTESNKGMIPCLPLIGCL